nr:hypothetical protein BaRGS_006672 [Batillaria attramentaria]
MSWNSSINSILSDRDRTDQPRSIITDYLKSVFIGANAVFKDLETSGIRLDARIVSIEFIEDETIAEETVPGSGFVDVDSVLEQFHAWLAPKHYPRTDHTMLFTGLNMTNGTDGADPEKDPIGVAFIGRMCNPTKSLSAIQNIPNAKVSIVIAHELGHSLNASHDGDGNTCSNKSYNVMDAITENNNTKKWHFSTCSVAYFKDMLDALNKELIALYKEKKRKNIGCEYGDKDIACNNLTYPYACNHKDTAEGCCGSCAPYFKPANIGCEYGDKTKDCETLTYPQACYSAQNANACCGTCAQYHDPTRVGCEYGDKSSGCSKTLAVPDSPFCQANNNICCLSCAADVTFVSFSS